MKTLHVKSLFSLRTLVALVSLAFYMGQSTAVFAKSPPNSPPPPKADHNNKDKYWLWPQKSHAPAPVMKPPHSPSYNHRPPSYDHRHYDPYPRGVYHRSLPSDVFWLSVGGAAFYYSMGKFYKSQSSGGYITVEAPIGARVRELPPNCTTYNYNGRYIYDCQDVYYDRDGRDYIVINRPVQTQVIISSGEQVMITAESLNIRTGPGSRYQVIGQLYRGAVVEVDGFENGWYYVRLSNDAYGWIAQDYTTPYKTYSRPKG